MASEDSQRIDKYTRTFLHHIGLTKDDLAPSFDGHHEYSPYELLPELDPGDHVAVWQTERGYWHHGIYCGKYADCKNYVVDLTPEFGVACRPYTDFIHHEESAIVIDYTDAFPKDATLQFAKYAVHYAKECPIHYNVVLQNCDKLALMLRAGRVESDQINKIADWLKELATFLVKSGRGKKGKKGVF